jgi:hypothetical protein
MTSSPGAAYSGLIRRACVMTIDPDSTPEQRIFRRQIEEHAIRLNNVQLGYEVWRDLLTEAERSIVGEFKEAYNRGAGRTVGIWALAKGIGLTFATIELARLYGLPEATCQSFLKQLNDQERSPQSWDCQNRPYWNDETSELHWNGEVIRRIRNRKTGEELLLILKAFEEEGWPHRIDSPISESPNVRRLGDRLKSLNTGLSQIRFRADGSGTGIVWSRKD